MSLFEGRAFYEESDFCRQTTLLSGNDPENRCTIWKNNWKSWKGRVSVADSCNNLARGIRRRNEGKSEFTDEQNHNIDQMFALLEKALTRMNEILHMQEVVHDDINQSYNIENEINNYRNQLKIHNMEDVNNKKYQYQDGVYYMDLVGESEKLGDYVLNVVQAVIEKKI